jgi:hypothetical protein
MMDATVATTMQAVETPVSRPPEIFGGSVKYAPDFLFAS